MNKSILLLAFLTVAFWASGFVGVRASILEGFSAGPLLLYRFLIASSIFFFYSLYSRSALILPKKKDFGMIFVLGILGIFFFHFGTTFGQITITSGTTSMIVGTTPI